MKEKTKSNLRFYALVAFTILCILAVALSSCSKDDSAQPATKEATVFKSLRSDSVKVCVSDTYMFLAPFESKTFRSEGGNTLKFGVPYHVHRWDGRYWVVFQEGYTESLTLIN